MIRNSVILSTGDELTTGKVVDSNSAVIAEQLFSLGVEVAAVLKVGDDPEKLRCFPFEPDAFSSFVTQVSGGEASKPSEVLIRLQKAAQRAMRNNRRTISSKIVDEINSEGF